ncbi:MAG: hypothetical protein A3G13_01870 [Candidatus Levybacteria bacterium RIFCSPLOWO2_12_FULL_37_7]|nr:MAG: hypothetical protein A3G13_01870 [Candidatus Levybacteria bacterium RIFCSPLOWO2_12_FULL_37_7]
MKDVFLSVIIPALNEEENIADAIKGILGSFDFFNIRGELLVVNDGSTDSTELKVLEFGDNDRISLINHDTPKGIGGSFWDGVDHARGEVVTMFPGDNENDPYETMRYIGLMEHIDILIPFVYNREARSAFRNFLSLIYRKIINMTFATNLNYTNGTIIYRKKILKNLKYRSSDFFFQTDILIRLLRKKYLFAEVPYRLNARKGGVSKAVSYPSLIQVIKGYLNLIKDVYYFNKRYESVMSKNKSLRGSATAKRRILDQQLRHKESKEA